MKPDPNRPRPSPPSLRDSLESILDDAPSYDPSLGLTVEQVGSALNELRERLEALIS